MSKIVVVGGGWAGCAAAIAARKQGDEVVLLEKTDLLLGAGNAGGIMRNNGRFTATEENIAMGASELFQITDQHLTHQNIDFPGHAHASFYDINGVEPAVRKLLGEMGIQVRLCSRAIDVAATPETVTAVPSMDPRASGSIRIHAVEYIAQQKEPQWLEADCFVEATGSSGPMGNCMAYGHGCAMCVQRCPAFGPRVSLTSCAGLYDLMGRRESGTPGALSGSCKLEKRSLSKKLQKKLSKEGCLVIPLPAHLVNRTKLAEKVCQQYALDAFAENVVIIDTGEAKLMSPFFDLETLRQLPGLEHVRFLDPLAGGHANSVRYMSVGARQADMRATGISNLYLAGEKSGFFVGHTEAITTGSLAGYNAACAAHAMAAPAACAPANTCAAHPPAARPVTLFAGLRLPRTLATGELLAYAQELLETEEGLRRRLTFAGGEFFQHMKDLGLYSTDPKAIGKAVETQGLRNIYNQRAG